MTDNIKKLNKRVDTLLTLKASREAQLAELEAYVTFMLCLLDWYQYYWGRFESYYTFFPYHICGSAFSATENTCVEPS